jgi:hypothetical protein
MTKKNGSGEQSKSQPPSQEQTRRSRTNTPRLISVATAAIGKAEAEAHKSGGDPDAVEIGKIWRRGNQLTHGSILCYIDVGQRLQKKKDSLERGEWGTWLKDNIQSIGFKDTSSTPQRLMRLARNYSASTPNLQERATEILRELWGNDAEDAPLEGETTPEEGLSHEGDHKLPGQVTEEGQSTQPVPGSAESQDEGSEDSSTEHGNKVVPSRTSPPPAAALSRAISLASPGASITPEVSKPLFELLAQVRIEVPLELPADDREEWNDKIDMVQEILGRTRVLRPRRDFEEEVRFHVRSSALGRRNSLLDAKQGQADASEFERITEIDIDNEPLALMAKKLAPHIDLYPLLAEAIKDTRLHPQISDPVVAQRIREEVLQVLTAELQG